MFGHLVETKHGCLRMSETPPTQSNPIPRLKKFRWSQRTCVAVERLAALHPELPENQSIALTLRWLDGFYLRRLSDEARDQYMRGELSAEVANQKFREKRAA
jgi:hypothetical protein